MNNLNTYAIFGIMFFAATLIANGMYSSQIFAQHENVNGTLNEAEINADIEQENKCKKDTECENENEINNQLSITTITQAQQEQQPETPTCETCFTDNLSESAISFIEETFFEEPSSLQEICQFIDENIQDQEFLQNFVNYLFDDVINNSDATEEDLDNLLNCLEEVFGVTFPETNIAK